MAIPPRFNHTIESPEKHTFQTLYFNDVGTLDSIEKTGKELEAAGFPGALVGPPSEVRPGLTPGHSMRVSMIVDPEGNPIEVFEYA